MSAYALNQAVSRVMMSSKPTSFPAQMECSRAVETSQMTVKNVAANPGSDLQRVFGDLANVPLGRSLLTLIQLSLYNGLLKKSSMK